LPRKTTPLFERGDHVVEQVAGKEFAEVVAVAEHERRVDDSEARVPGLEVVEGIDEEVLRTGDEVFQLRGDRFAELARVEDLDVELAVGFLLDAFGEELDRLTLIGGWRKDVSGLQSHRRAGGRCDHRDAQ
jgi:hypothetical protein